MRAPSRAVLGLAAVLGTAAVLAFTHQAGMRAVWQELTLVPLAWVGAALLLVLCQVACQAGRLWAILPRDVALSMARTAYAFTVGEWANIFTPARGGDALKIVLLNRVRGEAPFSLPKATGAILADKVVDFGTLVVLAALSGATGVIRAGARGHLPRAGVVVAVAVGVVILLLGVVWVRPQTLARLTVMRRELAGGLSALTDSRRLLASNAFSVGAWVVEVLALGLLCTAVGFPLSPPQLVLALAVMNVGASIPVTPANLGVYEAALTFGLSSTGVALPAAVAVATLHHAIELVAINLAAAGSALWFARAPRSARIISDQ